MRRNGARAVLRGGGAGDSISLPDYPKTHMLGAIAQLETELRAERQRDAIQDVLRTDNHDRVVLWNIPFRGDMQKNPLPH